MFTLFIVNILHFLPTGDHVCDLADCYITFQIAMAGNFVDKKYQPNQN